MCFWLTSFSFSDPCQAVSVQQLIELAVRNPRAMAKSGALKELFRLMIEPPHVSFFFRFEFFGAKFVHPGFHFVFRRRSCFPFSLLFFRTCLTMNGRDR